MGVQLLPLNPADLAAPVPRWETGVGAQDVGVAIIDGPGREWDATSAESERILHELAGAPVITIAVVPEEEVGRGAMELIESCDLAVRASAGTTVDELVRQISVAPDSALVAAQVLRGGGRGLLDESFAYSMLLAGESFARWRGENERHEIADNDLSRVAVERRPTAWLVRLTRPQRHNAFDARMREELCDALDAVAASRQVLPVILLGDGPSFCSGGDLDEFGTARDPVSAHLVRTGRSAARRLERIADRLIAGVHGNCIGAGVELAAYAQHIVAAHNTRFDLPELSLGLNLGAGGTISIPRRIGRRRTLEMLLRRDHIDAAEALDWGLVDELAQPADVESRCLQLASALHQEN